MANRITQAPVETLITTTNAKVRITQAAPEVLITTTNAKVRLTQAVVEVLIPNALVTAHPRAWGMILG